MAKGEGIKLIANNKKAYHDYFILDTYEAGISLHGTEVKSLRMGKCSIKEAFVRIDNGEMFIYGMHISPYEKGNIFNKDPLRDRKLLLHKSEIMKMLGKMKEKGIAVVPLKVYFKGSLVKVESVWQEVRSCMTSEMISQRRTRREKQSESSRCGISDKSMGVPSFSAPPRYRLQSFADKPAYSIEIYFGVSTSFGASFGKLKVRIPSLKPARISS